MTFVVGDIHGEYSKLILLVNHILFLDAQAKFIFVGDYLDKGENPLQTLNFLTHFSTTRECVFLRGNHEHYWHLLKDNDDQYAEYLFKYGGLNTVHSLDGRMSMLEAKKHLFSEFRSFFDSLRNYWVTDQYLITHSGLPPDMFHVPIGNIEPERLLFNRYDFIGSNQLYFGKRIVFGHTGFYFAFYDGYKIGIDTAACYLRSQPLTAFCLDNEILIDSNNNIIELADIAKSFCPAIPRMKAWQQIN